MQPSAILLSSLLASGVAGTWAEAQTDPFQRTAPSQVAPSLRGAAAPVPAPASQAASAAAGATFGNPRTSSDGSQTRVVFDLAPGVTYSLMPTFGGLRLDVRGAQVLPMGGLRLGTSVSEYRASGGSAGGGPGGGTVTLVTPFPLSLTDGWRASEATVASGARVLILEFGPTLSGGASGALRALVRTTPPGAAPPVNLALSAAPAAPATAAGPTDTGLANPGPATAGPPTAAPSGLPLADLLPPGDTVPRPSQASLPPPAPALPGNDPGKPSALEGRAPGSPASSSGLTPPRVGKNPGMTRVVLDLPPGASYRLVPGGSGMRVELSGVGASTAGGQNVSPEVLAWRYDPVPGGVTVTLQTPTPLTNRSGWRAQLVPPLAGTDRSRLAIDFSPALADLTPLSAREKVLAAVPPLNPLRGTAILAFSANLVQPRVVIDPGHGGHDPGAVGSVVEKQATLDVALRVRDLLRAAGVDVVLTRDRDRELNPVKATDLDMRAAMGTPGTQLFVSIHVNAMTAQNALRGYGVETWWNPNHPLSSSLAAVLQKNVISVTGAFSQGLRNNRSLAVLRESRIPAALVEIGYTSHPVDGLNLQDSNYLDRVALGIAQGIREALVTGISANGVAASTPK